MTPLTSTDPFVAVDHSILEANMEVGEEFVEERLVWEVSYGDPDPNENDRYVMGWLRATGSEIQVTVSIGTLVVGNGLPFEEAEFADIFATSDSCDALYNSARMAAAVLVGLTKANLPLSPDMPTPEMVKWAE